MEQEFGWDGLLQRDAWRPEPSWQLGRRAVVKGSLMKPITLLDNDGVINPALRSRPGIVRPDPLLSCE